MYQVLRACIAPKTAINDRENNKSHANCELLFMMSKAWPNAYQPGCCCYCSPRRIGSPNQVAFCSAERRRIFGSERHAQITVFACVFAICVSSLVITNCPKSTSAASLPQGRQMQRQLQVNRGNAITRMEELCAAIDITKNISL